MTIGFVGAGTMAGAIVRGITAAGVVPGADVLLYDVATDAARRLAGDVGATVARSAEEVVRGSDVVVLAVKPQVLPAVLTDLAGAVTERRPVLVSIAAGITLGALEELLGGGDVPVVRVMPNVNAMIGAGMAAVCGNAAASAEDVARVVEMFDAVGGTVEIAEKDFATYTAIAGSSPAFVFTFIDALARGAVRGGMPKALATRIAAQAVLGSARMVLERAEAGVSPADLVDMVCSPGGTTIAGIVEMEEAGFSPAVVRGVQAVIDRDRELGG